ncbi:restriction modification system DNA specificity domain [Phocaeicola salanitronis DSM 18170]|uniref:Restriction modification system DNA specificity domain n=1 Tax=Phocaeicola salanitronis (strain DSM 18170 / JCM 13657 / CCUG 60908 / BL78) TaxID=667015 RepID=F0QZG5_PHOSB|nr:restriction endonuclease subunit S [Phocaeicola salanitronis]ADY35110.1 restriction modification system DNA specificity domain [Phocaeicola salanitronis DSM 18170]
MMERYSEYKDSGVQWLGKIPSHWEVKRLASCFTERKVKVSDKEFDPLSVTKNGIYPQLENVAKTNDGDNRKLVLSGDFVINSRSDRKGSSGVAKQDGSVSLINIVLKPRKNIYPDFCNYLLKCYSFIEEYYRNGRGIVADLWTTRYDEMKTIKISVPLLNEQKAIVRYLNKVTSKIDEAIAQQQKMIDLLNERKQIIINNAVTKGLNPDVPMKNSGVEWIGKIPKHWTTIRLGYCAWIRARLGWKGLKSDEYVDNGYPFLSAFNIVNNKLDWNKLNYINKFRYEESPEIKLRIGDILLVKDGAGIGKCARVDSLPLGEATANGSLAFITANERVYYKFLHYYIISNSFNKYKDLLITGMGVPHLTQGEIKNMMLPIPPLNEQYIIVQRLDKNINVIDNILEHYLQQITFLQERKRIIINDVVTGKVKVS